MAITTASLVDDVLQASPSKMCGGVADRLMSTIALSKANEKRLEIKSTTPNLDHTCPSMNLGMHAAWIYAGLLRPFLSYSTL